MNKKSKRGGYRWDGNPLPQELKRKTISIRLSPAIIQKLDDYVQQTSSNRSQAIEKLIQGI